MTRNLTEAIKSGTMVFEGAYEGDVSIKGVQTGKGTARLQIAISGPRSGLNVMGMSARSYKAAQRSMELVDGKAPPTPRQ